MPSRREIPTSRGRVTMRMVAEAAGVSVQSVSLALRNHPSVGRDTRARIQQLAKKIGYVPDPALVRLMHHLRSGARQTRTTNVCALTTRPPHVSEVFCDLLLAGARDAARAAGFALQVLYVDIAATSGRRLERILRSRGVDGLILLPMADLSPLDGLLEWEQFSVVSATLSVTSPRFNRVAADHFQNFFTLSERLAAAGYRRPGLVIRAQHDKRCGHCITAAHAWQGIYGRTAGAPAHVCERLERDAVRRWREREHPDILLVEHDEIACALHELGVTDGLPIVSCSARPTPKGTFPFPGIYDEPLEIGAAAMDMLTGMIAQGKRGVPPNAQTTLLRGIWVGELPAPRRRVAPAAS